MDVTNYFQIIIILLISLHVFGENENVCGPPPIIREARIVDEARTQQIYANGTSLSYQCNVGYVNHGENRAICNHNGSWSFDIFCNPVECGDPGDIEHGFRIGDEFTHPNSVQFVCNEGYLMNTNESPFLRHCQANKQWSNYLPFCLVINCSIPENPAYGSIMYREVTYGSKAIYDCGFTRKLIGISERECTKNGEWSGNTPQCVEMECNYPDLIYPHGKVKMLDGTRPNDKIQYLCDDGTVTEAICFAQGIWVPSPPVCMTGNLIPTTPQLEQYPSSIRPHVNSTPHPRKKNKMIRLLCLIIFHLSHLQISQCKWHRTFDIEYCPSPPEIPNAFPMPESWDGIDKMKQAFLTYKCETGYSHQGDISIYCVKRRHMFSWSKPAFTCNR
uniref:Sushi domain-containing protein n=1 Tax=Strigamia maritima TaxID=126957 RepID=T1IM49_STRMM